MNHFYLDKRTDDKTLTAATRARREAEKEEMTLETRVAMLQEEEFKNFKKIEDTKRKAAEIYSRKKRAQENLELKMALKRKREEELGRDKNNFTDFRRQQALNLIQVREGLRQLKHEEFMKIKQQREAHESMKHSYMQNVQQQNLSRRMNIQEQLGEASRRKKEFFETKLQSFRENYESRIRQEERLKRKKELRISQLEETESELINRLKLTQSLQEDALKELRTAMVEPVSSYETKYISSTPAHKKDMSLLVEESLLITPKRTDILKKVKSGVGIRNLYGGIRERTMKLQDPSRSTSNFRGVPSKNPDELILTSDVASSKIYTQPDENDDKKPEGQETRKSSEGQENPTSGNQIRREE